MGGPSLWNSSIVSTLQEPLSNNSNNTGSPDGSLATVDNNSLTAVPAVANVGNGNSATAITSPIASSKKTSKSSPNSANSSMVYKKIL